MRHHLETQPVLDEQYVDTGKVRFVFKHFPLPIHPQAPAAGAAAECASDQGAFWEMYDLLFANVDAWSVDNPSPVLTDLANQIELDTDAFAACLEDEATAARVASDLTDGSQYVQGTPTFIILYGGGGQIIPGALPAETFTQELDRILAEIGVES
jgi:protein-disulfide isomerase